MPAEFGAKIAHPSRNTTTSRSPLRRATMTWLRRIRSTTTHDHVLADLRYAVRGMRRSPGFYSVAILMLALGIGVNAAIFSVFAQILLSPLHFSHPGSLYVISSQAASLGDARRSNSGPDFRDYRDQNTVFSEIAADRRQSMVPKNVGWLLQLRRKPCSDRDSHESPGRNSTGGHRPAKPHANRPRTDSRDRKTVVAKAEPERTH